MKHNMVWLRFLPRIGRGFIVSFLYFPPRSSPFAVPEVYEKLSMALETKSNSLMSKDSSHPAVILMGDHNARTGHLSDVDYGIIGGSFQPDVSFSDTEESRPPPRLSCDKEVNQEGRYLVEFCRSSRFKIVHSRKEGENAGFTYTGHT